MSVQATILIPTFDHGPLLLRSVGSALRQTVREIEVFMVGDGVPDVTRRIVAELASADPRVRFFDHPKGPRHGEGYRHQVLAEARGRIVCYLCDDDLHLPDHVATMLGLLREADFAHTLPVCVEADGSLRCLTVDLALEEYPRLLLSGENRVMLSAGAHTLAAYRGLPAGWRTTPSHVYTDLFMWQQFLDRPGYRFVSGTRPTLINFPGPLRRGWTAEQRARELDDWLGRIERPGWYETLTRELLTQKVRDAARTESAYLAASRALGDVTQTLAEARRELELTRRWPEAFVLRRLEGLRRLYGALRRGIRRRRPPAQNPGAVSGP